MREFQPVKNPFGDSGIDGVLIDNYEDPKVHEYIFGKITGRSKNPQGLSMVEHDESGKRGPENCFLWTVVTGDDDNWYIVPGYHFVNRLGYIICKVPWPKEIEIQVKY